MFTPLVRFLLPDGRVAVVPAGGILGRLATATLRFDDARVSEAHALVSLRGGLLWILALRGTVAVDGKLVREAPLLRGAQVGLVEGLSLVVESVEVPPDVVVLELEGVLHPLIGEVMSLTCSPDFKLVPRFVEGAPLRVWTSGIGWRGQVAAGRAFDVRPGTRVTIGGAVGEFRAVAPSVLAAGTTTGAGFHLPLSLRTTLDELRVTAAHRPVLLVGGLPARIVRELADYREPVPWMDVARAVLGPDDEVGLRTRWDRNLKTLRRKLEEHGYRSDLVRSDGHGNVSLALGGEDRIEVV